MFQRFPINMFIPCSEMDSKGGVMKSKFIYFPLLFGLIGESIKDTTPARNSGKSSPLIPLFHLSPRSII